jgi:hypothetical protein
MQNKFTTVVCLVICDVARASITGPRPHNRYKITLQYYNEYVREDVTCTIRTKIHTGRKSKKKIVVL